MRRFPFGVAVVTVDTGAERAGLTVGSIVSLSLEPPLVGVSIARTSPFHDLLREAGSFAVNLLAEGQEALAQHFARSGVPPLARFHGVRVRDTAEGAPLLEGALGWLRCRVWAAYDASTHTLFVGEVETVEHGPAADALVYVQGRYRAL